MRVDFNQIKDAVRQRDEFLNMHPELMALQEEITRLLTTAGNDKRKRNMLLQELLLESWNRITQI